MVKTIIIFAICSLINVMLNTVKTIIMYKQNKLSSSLINAITYGFYTVIVVLMAGEMPLVWKISMTAITNFIGVWLSMIIMDKFHKDALWKIELTIKPTYKEIMEDMLVKLDIPHNIIYVGKYYIFNVYSASQKQSIMVKEIANECKAKYFVTESKTL